MTKEFADFKTCEARQFDHWFVINGLNEEILRQLDCTEQAKEKVQRKTEALDAHYDLLHVFRREKFLHRHCPNNRADEAIRLRLISLQGKEELCQ